jgi:hypothetical protein
MLFADSILTLVTSELFATLKSTLTLVSPKDGFCLYFPLSKCLSYISVGFLHTQI